jgi:hypothetical protein
MKLNRPLTIRGTQIQPTNSLRYLSVFLDPDLSGKAHLQYLQAKAATLTAALSSIAGSVWGVPTLHLRRMYIAVLTPQLLYGCSTWYTRGSRGHQSQAARAIKTLENIQHEVLHQIGGAFKTTSRAAL